MRTAIGQWHSMTSTLPVSSHPSQLPFEILIEIFELARYGVWNAFHRNRDGLATLYKCSLVCRAWAECAQHVMFRNVNFDTVSWSRFSTEGLIVSFTNGLELLTARQSPIPRSVHSLRFRVGSFSHSLWKHSELCTAAKALSLCPNLRKFGLTIVVPRLERFHGGRQDLFTDEELSLLSRLRSVTHLTLNVSHDSELLRQFLDTWPSISSLTLDCYCPIFTRSSPKQTHNITEFRAKCHSRCRSSHVTKFLCSDESTVVAPLQTLMLGPLQTFKDTVGPFQDTLTTLVMEFTTLAMPGPDVSVLSTLTSLRRVIVGIKEYHWNILNALPESVTEFGIWFYLSTFTTEWWQMMIDFILHRPQIVALLCVYSGVYHPKWRHEDYSYHNPPMDGLLSLCDVRGIEVIPVDYDSLWVR